MTIPHAQGERLAIVVLGSSHAKNMEALRLALRLGVRTSAIGEGRDELDALLSERSVVERHGLGETAPAGDGVVIFDARS